MGHTNRLRASRRRAAALMTTMGLIAGMLAISASSVSAASPTVSLSSSVVGLSVTIAITVNRQSKAIALCTLVSGSTTTGCGSPTSWTKKTTTYSVLLTDQIDVGSADVSVRLTDGGKASSSISFTITDADSDGVPNATDNCPTIANAAQGNTYGSTNGDACEDTDGDAILDVNEADMCVSVNGVAILDAGTSTCHTEASTGSGPNIAVANGYFADAFASYGNNNAATAIGIGSQALAYLGDDNTATATDHARAIATGGNNNVATATDIAQAIASDGNNNTATATGNFAEAFAHDGNHNTATATGDHASAEAFAADGCTYVAPPNGSCS